MGGIAKGFMGSISKPKAPRVAPVVMPQPAAISKEERAATEKTKAAEIAKEQETLRKKMFEQRGRASTNVSGMSAKSYLGS